MNTMSFPREASIKRGVIVAATLLLLITGCTATTDVPEPELTVASPTSTPSPTAVAVDWEPQDQGPRTGAMGETTVDDRGVTVTYTVVEGDTADQIRERFDIWRDTLADEEGVALIAYPEIYPGDVLAFAPSRMTLEPEED